MRTFRLYGFIDEIEQLLDSDGRENTAAENLDVHPDSSTIWIEADCIDADHFDSLVENPPPLLDPSYRTDESLLERRQLLDKLFVDGLYLKTLYLTAITKSQMFRRWRRHLKPSTWHSFTVTLDGHKRIDISQPNLLSKEKRRHLLLMALDPFTPQAQIVESWEIEPATARVRSDLAEVISLNHIDDLPLGSNRGDGGLTRGPLIPKPMPSPPLFQFETAGEFERHYDAGAASSAFDSASQGALDVFYDPEDQVWTFSHAGRRYINRNSPDSHWLSQTDGQPYLLFEVAGRVLLYPKHAIYQKPMGSIGHVSQPAKSAHQEQPMVAYQRSGS